MPPSLSHLLVLQQQRHSAYRLQLEPLLRQRRQLQEEGLTLDVALAGTADEKLATVRSRLDATPPTAIAVQFAWAEKADDVIACLSRLREAAPEAKLIYLDAFDGTPTPHLAVLPTVDLYVKKQLPVNLDDLAVSPRTGGLLARRIRAIHEMAELPETQDDDAALLREHTDRLRLGWNVATADFVYDRLFAIGRGVGRIAGKLSPRLRLESPRRVPGQSAKERPIDLHCRVGLGNHGTEDWYRAHRRAAVAAVDGMHPGRHVITSAGSGAAVSPQQFWRELTRTRLCISPFGYGEICYRDFEALAAGCVLVKPDMSHLRTWPDVYRPHETYIPVRWDWSDFAEAVEPYLAEPDRCEQLARAGRAALIESLTGDRLSRKVHDLL